MEPVEGALPDLYEVVDGRIEVQPAVGIRESFSG